MCYYRRAEEYTFRSFTFTRQGFGQFLESLSRRDEVAIESVTQANYLVEQISSRVKRVVVVNTFAFDVIKRSRSKTVRSIQRCISSNSRGSDWRLDS